MKIKYLFLLVNVIVSISSKETKPKVALITGIAGQDGVYLAEFLLKKDYIVHGLRRRVSINTQNIEIMLNQISKNFPYHFSMHIGDITDGAYITRLIQTLQPDEIYNLAAQSHVKISFDNPEHTAFTNAFGPLKILEAIRISGLSQKTKFYQASSSEMYGKVVEIPQTELTPFYPRSPYGVAKAFAHWIIINYRESYKIFACNGILSNHESPLRNDLFVTRKITRSVSEIAYGLENILYLGNLNARRDWGYAKEYVEAMWMILQYDKPEDWIIATGETHTIREFTEEAFKCAGILIRWEGEGIHEKGYDAHTNRLLVAIDEQFFRPSEVDSIIGNPQKAKKLLGWSSKITFKELIKIMIDSDMKITKQRLTKNRLKMIN